MNPSDMADSHAGQHGDFIIFWSTYLPPNDPKYAPGWYWYSFNETIGPFETSQAAFGDYKDYVDDEIRAATLTRKYMSAIHRRVK